VEEIVPLSRIPPVRAESERRDFVVPINASGLLAMTKIRDFLDGF
jgi:hypothetical protein